MTSTSPVALLVLHAARLLGFADTAAVAQRFDLDAAATHEHLLDAQANGWVTRTAFADTAGWAPPPPRRGPPALRSRPGRHPRAPARRPGERMGHPHRLRRHRRLVPDRPWPTR